MNWTYFLLSAGLVVLHLRVIETENPYGILFGGFVAGICFAFGIVHTLASRR